MSPTTEWPIHARFDGSIVMIGFGSIGRGTLPLILRHIACDPARITVIAPDDDDRRIVEEAGGTFVKLALDENNYRRVLTPLIDVDERTFMVNLSVDVSSVSMMELCREHGALYIDTVVEPWAGWYYDPALTMEQRSNYALRESMLELRRRRPGGITAVTCCGANPGMVSWFVKQALLNLAADLGEAVETPKNREQWAALMQRLGVKGVHIAERDTQQARTPKPAGTFVNTWSVDGFIAEGMQPAELGWGTHEKALPPQGATHDYGSGAAIWLKQYGAATRVRSWTPTPQAQMAFLITHNESISIADFFTVYEGGKAVFRPTCHYAYYPCDDAVLSLQELADNDWTPQKSEVVLDEADITEGIDELGVLLYGHAKNAYWYGSQLSIEETRELAPYQNATGLQVTSAVLAGMVWALENPESGIVEADEMDFARCLEIQMPYLGPVVGVYTDWTPLDGTAEAGTPDNPDTSDPWQFANVFVR